ncbi:MAG: OB-fold domain-containing protein, partial [Candidatus Omnitrophica bacterium]|nr:OB-fold domain-containing protein [Candidatus Omnitrophota bacterium]
MISRLEGYVKSVSPGVVEMDLNGVVYQVNVSKNTEDIARKYFNAGNLFELMIYHYLSLDKSKGYSILIGFTEILQKEFFEKFISVSGIGPKAALKAFEQPVGKIADAIELG